MKKIFLNLIILMFVSLTAFALQIPPVNGNVTISASGATDRTQMTSLSVSSCTIQALTTNAGSVYVGGSTVTNSSGTNQGIKLIAGASLGSITVTNLNMIYVAADNAGDKVAYVCN